MNLQRRPRALQLREGCHLYFGGFQDSTDPEERKKYTRRVLEIVALSKWADGRYNGTAAYDKDIVVIGDMNVPTMDPDESTYKEFVTESYPKCLLRSGGKIAVFTPVDPVLEQFSYCNRLV